MSESVDANGAPVALSLLVLAYAFSFFPILVGIAQLDEAQVLLVMPFVLEYMSIGLVAVLMAEADADGPDWAGQRSGETNAWRAVRVWLTIHWVLLREFAAGIARSPRAVRRAVAWLRKTPEENDV